MLNSEPITRELLSTPLVFTKSNQTALASGECGVLSRYHCVGKLSR